MIKFKQSQSYNLPLQLEHTGTAINAMLLELY